MKRKNKVALITGASRGIGYAIARELAQSGYSLALAARTSEQLEEASRQLKSEFPEAPIISKHFDVACRDDVFAFVAEVLSQFGGIDVLVNNAGVHSSGTSMISRDVLQRMMEVNFTAAVDCTQAVLSSMKAQQSGYIISIASICGVETYPTVGAYCASKFALVGYSTALDQEVAEFGIKATAVCPSWVDTRMASESPLSPDQMIRTEDLALTVRYLLSLGPAARIREIVINC
jgi:3-oxoacyl-[acyl-carrier protein] reductase